MDEIDRALGELKASLRGRKARNPAAKTFMQFQAQSAEALPTNEPQPKQIVPNLERGAPRDDLPRIATEPKRRDPLALATSETPLRSFRSSPSVRQADADPSAEPERYDYRERGSPLRRFWNNLRSRFLR